MQRLSVNVIEHLIKVISIVAEGSMVTDAKDQDTAHLDCVVSFI
jgi:hypothetical protein